jgi:hypothetical protein
MTEFSFAKCSIARLVEAHCPRGLSHRKTQRIILRDHERLVSRKDEPM